MPAALSQKASLHDRGCAQICPPIELSEANPQSVAKTSVDVLCPKVLVIYFPAWHWLIPPGDYTLGNDAGPAKPDVLRFVARRAV